MLKHKSADAQADGPRIRAFQGFFFFTGSQIALR